MGMKLAQVFGLSRIGGLLLVVALVLGLLNAPVVAQEEQETAAVASEATVESLFVDFMHYARLGRFTAADGFARALLAHPDLDPVAVLEVAEKDRQSVDTLLILIKNSSLGDNAARVLELIEQGEHERRRDPARIKANIAKLGGDPQQEYLATRRLADSGEYTIPWMVRTLLDPAQAELKPRVLTALPQIGKPAVRPLVMALRVRDDDIRQHLIRTLGEIGYPHAAPYLHKLIVDPQMPESTKQAATAALARIEAISGRPIAGTPPELFYRLGEKFYDEDESVRADPRLDEANVWYWDATEQSVTTTVVPTRIFGQVMALRCCEEALQLQPDMPGPIALWLAANIRRESRLGFDVETGDPEATGDADATRPEVYPRALYFTQAAGARYAHLVLERAVKDVDTAVALGAIEALRLTAGESSLIGTEDYKQPLVQALQFPELLVRIRAALALGAALPKSQFAGSEFVVPVLATALRQTGKRQMIVVDADEANLNRIVGELRNAETDVIGETSFYKAMHRARAEFQTLSAVYLSTDLADPALPVAFDELRAEFMYAKVPVVILVKPQQSLLAQEVAPDNPYVERVDAAADGGDLEERYTRITERTAEQPLDADAALAIALQATATLRRIAVDGRTVFDQRVAEPALIASLSSPSEELQIRAASVLALAPTETAQRALAHVALDDANSVTLRVAVFGSLSESAKSFGNLLEPAQIEDLVRLARDENDLVIRTAASQALGAINLATNQASDIIRSYYGG